MRVGLESIQPMRGGLRLAIQKMDFYQGAALYKLLRGGGQAQVRFEDGLAILDERLQVYLKYSTRTRSPWSFGFSASEQVVLAASAPSLPLTIGLVCGADGIAALPYEGFVGVAGGGGSQIAISCARRHNQQYAISGPGGLLAGKIAPSAWDRLLIAGD